MSSVRFALRTISLAVITVAGLHFAVGNKAEATTVRGCSHGACQDETSCVHVWNHSCCFASGQCQAYSCITQIDPCD